MFNKRTQRGFTIIEVVVSFAVFAIGMCALAALTAQTVTGTERARYIGVATTLASEKIEDLNKWPTSDPHIAAGGSLTTDATVTTGGSNYSYFDDIDLSNTSGQVSETVSTTSGGSTTYAGIVHYATGYVDNQATTAPAGGSGTIGFHRRWLVEADPVVNGITLTGSRRITVLVTLTNQIVQPSVSFQMSLIRP